VNYINFFFEETEVFDFPEETIKGQISKIIDDGSDSIGKIGVIFCRDEYLLELNKKYLNHDYYTDIITFNYSEGNFIAGDLYISVDRVKENSEKYKVPFIYELARVIFHGILHLIGYNDSNTEDKVIMRQKEDHYLKCAELLRLK
jgi:rRNA maturation RNase YbeY